MENESVFFSGLPPLWTFPSTTCSQPLAPSFTFRADSWDLAATLVQLPTAAGTGHCKSNAGSRDGVDESTFLHVGQGRAPVCRGQRHLWGTVWEKRLSLHAGRMPSDGEIYVRMFTQCSCSQGWESVAWLSGRVGGRVREKIYQSAELGPWDQNAKPGQTGRSFSRMLICVRTFGLVCSVLTDMLACGRRHWPLWGWVQCDPCTPGKADVSRGHIAGTPGQACPRHHSLTDLGWWPC